MKTLALDVSTTRIGWACGAEFGSEAREKVKGETEGEIFQRCYNIVMALWVSLDKPGQIVMEESNSSKNMITTRLLLGLRGILILAFRQHGIEVELLSVSSVRSRIGVLTGMPKGTSKYLRRKTVKQMVIKRVRELGYNVNNDDEADAVALYLAWEANHG